MRFHRLRTLALSAVCFCILEASCFAALSSDMLQRGQQAVDRLNLYRKLSGLPQVTLDTTLSEGCALHAAYLNLNKDQILGGLDAHYEFPDRPGYTEAGKEAGATSDINYGKLGSDAIDSWYETYYHRSPMINPSVVKVGYGDDPGSNVGFSISVLQFQFYGLNGDILSPGNGSAGNAVGGNGEVPEPVPNFGPSVGNPIIAYFSGEQVVWVSSKVISTGGEMPHTVIAPGKNANADFEGNEICLITTNPFPKNSTVTVEINYTQGTSKTLTWSFTTSSSGKFDPAAAGGTSSGGAPAGTPSVDTDGDGFLDEIETAAGTLTSDAASTPFSGQPAPTPTTLATIKLAIKLNFAKSASDGISLSGTLPFPDGLSVTGQQVIVCVGGVARAFSLDEKGRSVPKGIDSFKIATKPKDGFAKYSAKISKGTFSATLADEGLLGTSDTKNAQTSVRVIVIFNQQNFQLDQTVLYTAKAGKSGKTSLPR